MYKKKLTDAQFVELVIDKELEIAGADVRYKDIAAMPIEEQKHFDFYDKYTFKTLEQFLEWRQFFYDHFYDWQPKHVSKERMRKEFAWWNLDWGLICEFPTEQIAEHDKNIKRNK